MWSVQMGRSRVLPPEHWHRGLFSIRKLLISKMYVIVLDWNIYYPRYNRYTLHSLQTIKLNPKQMGRGGVLLPEHWHGGLFSIRKLLESKIYVISLDNLTMFLKNVIGSDGPRLSATAFPSARGAGSSGPCWARPWRWSASPSWRSRSSRTVLLSRGCWPMRRWCSCSCISRCVIYSLIFNFSLIFIV